eukprot:CAMPEP_0197047836 /NCGR_PEP_ID=MMETSP1384-20130603/23279_1 /TAXON_ID=29189 /ORGANISM="Ammonia sp." /LENGTH=350 /DNA_ID=CAMNT_0042479851 /DNA_START=51 /DNA_END=1103 /DNA_ORIENTATION=+
MSDEAVARLFNMGFTTDASTKALQHCNHDFDKALEWLIQHASSTPEPPANQQNRKQIPLSPPPKPPAYQQPAPKKHRRVQSLLDMGFTEKQAMSALTLHNNNVQSAIEYLIASTIPANDAQPDENEEDEFVLVNDEEEKKKDLEWQQITVQDLKNHEISPWDMELTNEYECTLLSPFKLKQIITKCPTRTHLYKWSLFYSTEKHGISVNTLYHRLEYVDEFVILINDATSNDIFGAFLDCRWTKPKQEKAKYKGSIDCFVFNYTVNNEIKDTDKTQLSVYKGSGYKKYFFRNDHKSVTIGAGECPALYFDFDFNLGRSVKCDTFNSPPLSKDTQFKIKKLEIWAPVVAHD